jgi:SAM-dependent methyltransferase
MRETDPDRKFAMSSVVGDLHSSLIFPRRTTVLAGHLAPLLTKGARILDVGCGDGSIDLLLMQQRPDISIEGIDLLVRPGARIPVQYFDGRRIPYPDGTFDTAMFVDVFHHTENPTVLLKEAARVARNILIKDHLREGFLPGATLRLMDWLGNAHHGVALPYNYWTKAQWYGAFSGLGLKVTDIENSLGLYPAPASWLFDRGLHFVARLERI